MLQSIDARLCILESLSVEMKEMPARFEFKHKEIKDLKRDNEHLKITLETLTKEMDNIVKKIKPWNKPYWTYKWTACVIT